MSSADTSTLTAVLVLTLVWLLVGVGFYVWYGWALSQLFKRLGTDSWRGWVPVLNEMTIFERGGVPAWNVVFYFVPIANLYALYLKFVATGRIGEHFGRSTGMAVLGALFTPLWATLLVLQRQPHEDVAQERISSVVGHRQMAGGLASTEPPSIPAPVATPTAPAAAPAATTHDRAPVDLAAPVDLVAPVDLAAPTPASAQAAESLAAPNMPATDIPITDLQAPPPGPMPEPAPPEAPVPSTVADSAPILVHNPWARPTAPAAAPAEPATDAAPATDVPAWLDTPASASATDAVPPVGADDDDEDDGETIVVDRRPRVQWYLNVDGADPLPLTGDHVILGRRPAASAPGYHPLAVPDTTRTLSKSHAQLDLVDGEWTIKDLGSTNGVLIVDEDGEESLITPGDAVPVTGRFILGKVGMHISFEQAGE